MLRNELLDGMSTLQGKFDTAMSDALNYDQRFDTLSKDFQTKASSLLKQLTTENKDHGAGTKADDNPLLQMLDQTQGIFDSLISGWQDALARQSKSVEFRKEMQDSLLVYMYGKLKAGKSSLSNYIAWGHTNPDEAYQQQYEREYAQLVPEYISFENTNISSGDAFNEAVHTHKFRIAATEATSTIQAFKLPGLTWVDSPGIHSTHSVNEALAKKYVANSDLILYLTRSDSPSRDSDLQELLSLARARKEMLVLISCSDEINYDVDDDGNVINKLSMKSKATREKQKQYAIDSINSVLQKNGIAPLPADRFYCISALYAQDHADDEAALEDSGLSRLFTELSDIAQKEGVRLKQNAPLQNYLSFLLGCRTKKFADIRCKLKECLEQFEVQSYYVKREADLAKARLVDRTKQRIDQIFDELRQYRNQDNEAEIINRKIKSLFPKVLKEIEADIQHEVTTIIHSIAQNMDEVNVQLSSSFKELPLFVVEMAEHPITRYYESGGSSGTGWGIFGGLLAGIVTTVVAGPVAGAIAASSTFAATKTIASSSPTAHMSQDSITVKAGDNLSKIQSDLELKLSQEVPNAFAKICDELIEKILSRGKQQLNALDKCMTDVDSQLVAMIEEIQKRLEK